MSLTFGLYKVLVPEKMNLNGKSVNTLTKTHNPSKRKGEQSISLVSSSKNSKPEVKINVDTKTARSNIAKLSKAVMEREKKKVNQLDKYVSLVPKPNSFSKDSENLILDQITLRLPVLSNHFLLRLKSFTVLLAV